MPTGKFALVFSVMLLCASLASAADPPAKNHTLPKNLNTPVVIMDQKGGMIRRTSKDPILQILPDGTVLVGDPFGMGRKIEGKITAGELQTLLKYILDQQSFAKITPDDLRLKANVMVGDGATTRIAVDADNSPLDLSAYAVNTVAQFAGPNSPASRFVAIQNRLERLVHETILGGKDGLAKQLKAANAKLKEKFPDEAPMTPEDLVFARALRTGTKATFQHKTTVGDKWHMTEVTVTDNGKGELTVDASKGTDVK